LSLHGGHLGTTKYRMRYRRLKDSQ
jgi:hypothetical protein